jgi:hypothetical protein
VYLFEISKTQPTLSHGQMMQQATLDLLNGSASDVEAHPSRLGPLRRSWRTRTNALSAKCLVGQSVAEIVLNKNNPLNQ